MENQDGQSPSLQTQTQAQPTISTQNTSDTSPNENIPQWKNHLDFILMKTNEKDLFDQLVSEIETSGLELHASPEPESEPKLQTLNERIAGAENIISMYKKLPSYEKLNLQLTTLKLKHGKMSPESVDITAVSQFLSDLPNLSFLVQANN